MAYIMKQDLRIIGAVLALAGLVGCSNSPNTISNLRPDGQIIGGTDATGNEDFTKTIVALYDVTEGSLCTASILSETILVTAAHCVGGSPADLRVVFGLDLESNNIIVRPVEAYQVSPVWPVRQNQELNTGDIAVVKFLGGLAPGFTTATLLSDINLLKNGQTTLLSGYGISDGVANTGAGRLRFVETTVKQVNFTKTEVLIDQTKGKGACHGDSGGPAYVEVNGKKLLWGVTSRGFNDPNNDCSVAAAYTSIPFYASWIERTAKALNSKTPTESARPSRVVAGF